MRKSKALTMLLFFVKIFNTFANSNYKSNPKGEEEEKFYYRR